MDIHIKLREIMVKEVVTATPDESVAIAAKRMREQRIGCLVVVQNDVIRGIITDRDLLDCVAAGHEVQRCKLSNHTTSPVVTCEADKGSSYRSPGNVRKKNQASSHSGERATGRPGILL